MFAESDIWVPEKCEESIDLLDMAYRREFMNIASIEDQHADSVSRQAFAMYMEACDGGYMPRDIEYHDVSCNTFELEIAKIAGACAAERRRRIINATQGVIAKLNPFNRSDNKRTTVDYGEFAVVQTLVRIRRFDDVPSDEYPQPFEIPPGQAAREVTKELLVEERAYYL